MSWSVNLTLTERKKVKTFFDFADEIISAEAFPFDGPKYTVNTYGTIVVVYMMNGKEYRSRISSQHNGKQLK